MPPLTTPLLSHGDLWDKLSFLVAIFVFGHGCSADARPLLVQYEFEGAIDQSILDDRFPIQVKGQFKVFVRDANWLIEIIEDKQLLSGRQYLKREIGSTNGVEIFEIVTPLEPENQQTNAVLKPAKNRPFNTATIVSNAVPVGQLDGSVVGHLWLMFASGDYLGRLQTNLLTPVYDVTASAPGDPNLKYKAHWELLDGPGSLPSKVTYFYDFRSFGENTMTNAAYQTTGITNVGDRTFPTGFLFEEYVGGTEARLRKRATAVVTAVRPFCSLDRLLPAVTGKTVVVDRRLAQAEQPVRAITYTASSNAPLPTVADVKQMHERKTGSQRERSPAVVAFLLATVCLPVLIWLSYLWRRRSKSA